MKICSLLYFETTEAAARDLDLGAALNECLKCQLCPCAGLGGMAKHSTGQHKPSSEEPLNVDWIA